ncbi:MAG: cyclic nucleotide-binding domain-containing protein [Candidatus Hydrogenedentes bacterium]|nr:cyclic nucleotide-binding domain-containing protein [Candidatus Hydrogenedentota bacterium]
MHIESYLGRNDLFMGLGLQTIERIAKEFQRITVKAGELIFAEGSRGDSYYLIATGEATVLKGSGVGQRELQRLGPGDGFGEMALVADEPRSATVKAVTDMELLSLSREHFVVLMDQEARFAQRILRLLSQRLRQTNQVATLDLLRAHQGLIISLAELAESRDADTGAHLYRVRDHCTLLAKLMSEDARFKDQVNEDFIEAIYYVSPLHDIGKVSIPDAILKKQGKLTDEEFEIMKTHTVVGGRALETVLRYCDLRMFRLARDIVLCHHERYDGKGYPAGIRGDEIPLAARIMSIADHYDALRSERVYKAAFTAEAAAQNLHEETGKRFDPVVAGIMLAHITQFEDIHEQYTDMDKRPDKHAGYS